MASVNQVHRKIFLASPCEHIRCFYKGLPIPGSQQHTGGGKCVPNSLSQRVSLLGWADQDAGNLRMVMWLLWLSTAQHLSLLQRSSGTPRSPNISRRLEYFVFNQFKMCAYCGDPLNTGINDSEHDLVPHPTRYPQSDSSHKHFKSNDFVVSKFIVTKRPVVKKPTTNSSMMSSIRALSPPQILLLLLRLVQHLSCLQKTAGASNPKDYKICSVTGGLDVARLVSSNTRSLFRSAIEDVELIREYISEAALNRGIVGGLSDLDAMSGTLDWKSRGKSPMDTTVTAGLAYCDDRVDRRVDRFVSLSDNQPFQGDKSADMALIDSASNLFPWIVDRRSVASKWWVNHANGRSLLDQTNQSNNSMWRPGSSPRARPICTTLPSACMVIH
jgi:hypothetical protein